MSRVRYCTTCGHPLSRYNAGERCGSCAARQRASRPALLPPGFALRDEVRAALGAGDWSTVLRAATAAGVSQTAIAMAAGVSQPQVSRLMSGRSTAPSLPTVRGLCDGLGLPRALVGLAPAGPEPGEPTTDRRTLLTTALGASLIAPMIEIADTPGDYIGADDAAKLRALAARITTLDTTHGGDGLCEIAVRCVEHADAILQHATFSEPVGRQIQTAVAELADAAGWAYYDAGQQHAARYWYQQALTTAQLMADLPMEVIVLCEMSMQAVHLGRPREAIQFAEHAARQATGWAPPRVQALTLLRQAAGHGATGDMSRTRRLVAQARHVYRPEMHDDDPVWIEFLDPAEVTSLEAVAYASNGQHRTAARLLGEALGERRGQHRRNEVFFRIRLAEELRHDGRLDDACGVAVETIPLLTGLQSSRTRCRAGQFFTGLDRRYASARDALDRAAAAGLVA